MRSDIAVLLPTRGRVSALRESVESLRSRQSGVTRIDLMVAVDEDDPASMETAWELDAYRIYTPSERYGYSRLNEYYNDLARLSHARWLMLWNDDAMMKTQDWDLRILEADESTLVVELKDQLWPGLCCFPVVREEAVAIVGGFSPHTPHCDTYWQDISRTLERNQAADVFLDHNRADLTGLNNDQTYRDSQAGYQTAEYYSPEVQSLIRADIEKLRTL